MRNETYQISTFAGAPGDRRNLKQCAMHSVQPRVIPFPLADMALATGSTRVGGIVGIVRAGGRGLGR